MRKFVSGALVGAASYWVLPTILIVMLALGGIAYVFSGKIKESNA